MTDYTGMANNFEQRNIRLIVLDSLEATKEYILQEIPISCTVGIGHSATLQQMDLTHALAERGNPVYDKETAVDGEESYRIKREALLSDYYISGANAISADGRIVNMDHSGNRVAALAFGPKKVILVAGVNKITETLETAIDRVKNIACPMNAERAGFHPPCVSLGRCVDCVSEQRICNDLSVIQGQPYPGRMTLLIVKQPCGF